MHQKLFAINHFAAVSAFRCSFLLLLKLDQSILKLFT